MKRELTFELKSIHPDYKTPMPKELEKRIGKPFKLIGEVKIGKGFEMYFEDGYIFKTAGLEVEGFINHIDKTGNLRMVTLCTKDICYEFLISEKKNLSIKIEEQLKLI